MRHTGDRMRPVLGAADMVVERLLMSARREVPLGCVSPAGLWRPGRFGTGASRPRQRMYRPSGPDSRTPDRDLPTERPMVPVRSNKRSGTPCPSYGPADDSSERSIGRAEGPAHPLPMARATGVGQPRHPEARRADTLNPRVRSLREISAGHRFEDKWVIWVIQ